MDAEKLALEVRFDVIFRGRCLALLPSRPEGEQHLRVMPYVLSNRQRVGAGVSDLGQSVVQLKDGYAPELQGVIRAEGAFIVD